MSNQDKDPLRDEAKMEDLEREVKRLTQERDEAVEYSENCVASCTATMNQAIHDLEPHIIENEHLRDALQEMLAIVDSPDMLQSFGQHLREQVYSARSVPADSPTCETCGGQREILTRDKTGIPKAKPCPDCSPKEKPSTDEFMGKIRAVVDEEKPKESTEEQAVAVGLPVQKRLASIAARVHEIIYRRGAPTNAESDLSWLWERFDAAIKKQITYCAFCGDEFIGDQFAENVIAHIKSCPNHPMHKREARIAELEQENTELKERNKGDCAEIERLERGLEELKGWSGDFFHSRTAKPFIAAIDLILKGEPQGEGDKR